MTDIEQRVRASLTARAADIAPTPELWREVDRRIARRRRVRVAAWSLAGAAAIVAGVLVLPGFLGTSLDVPEIDPIQTPPTPSEDGTEDASDSDEDPAPTTGGEDAGQGEGTGPGDPDGGPRDGVGLDATLLVAGDGELRLVGPEGGRSLTTFAEEGGSVVVAVAVRPGSSVDDLTAVVLTQAEGMWDLRTLRVEGEEVTLEVFPEGYRPGRGGALAGEGLAVRGPVWSPDGTSLAWLESGTGGVVLQTIGWSDGPGTGLSATDNAEWDVSDVLPPGSAPHDWVATEGQSTVIRATMSDSTEGWFAIGLDRQADGAWAFSGAQAVPVPAVAPGTVAAVAGVLTTEGAPAQAPPRWIVGTGVEGGRLLDRAEATARELDLPPDLLATDGVGQLWLVPVPGGVVVGSADTGAAFLVPDGGDPVRLEGTVAVADAL